MTDQGAVYLSYVTDELDREWKRRENLDSRGVGVLTSTSAVVTLILALVAVVVGKDRVVHSSISMIAALAALLLLLGAGVLGLLAHRLRTYDVPKADGYNTLVATPRWRDSETSARNAVAQLRVKTLTTLRTGNDAKVAQLEWALVLQLAGVAALSVAVVREALAVLGWWA